MLIYVTENPIFLGGVLTDFRAKKKKNNEEQKSSYALTCSVTGTTGVSYDTVLFLKKKKTFANPFNLSQGSSAFISFSIPIG